jgi:carboxymethylenebutenolidase
MCDDLTEEDNKRFQAALAEKRLGRREFATGVGATAAVVLVAGCESDDEPGDTKDAGATKKDAGATKDAGTATKSSMVSIDMADGKKADAFFVYPESGAHAAVIVWPDILGLRDAFKTMGTRLAGEGFAVLVLNQYYRSAKAPVIGSWDEWRTPDGMAKLQPMIAELTPDAITDDSAKYVEWLDKQAAVDKKKKIGTSGYCMGGPFTIRTAAKNPDRVGAFASLHGGNLVTDADNSPHKLLGDVKASGLIAIAMNDDERAPDTKTTLKGAAKAADVEAEIEVYPAQHGWCAIDSAAFDEEQANKAYERMLALFRKAL